MPSVHSTVPKQYKALFHAILSSIFSGIAAETLVSGFKPPTQPSFLKSCTKDMTMQPCTRSIRNCMSASDLLKWFLSRKKIWICFATATLVCYTQCAICTRFQTPFVGIVILTNPTLNAASLHYVDNDHALRKFGGMVIGYGELF